LCAEGTTLATLDIKEGYYRFGVDTEMIYRCPLGEVACNGSKHSACNNGYIGPLCDTCQQEPAHFRSSIDNTCAACGNTGHLWWVYIAVVVALVPVVWVAKVLYGLLKPCFSSGEEDDGDVKENDLWYLFKENVKTVFYTWQIITQMASLNEMRGGEHPRALTLP